MRIILSTLFACALLPASAALAEDCTDKPESEWMSKLDMQKMVVNDYGFTIHKFKIDGSCYEIYGWEPDPEDQGEMRRIEVYFNPISGEIFEKHLD